MVGVRASEGGVSDNLIYRYVLGPLAILRCIVPVGHRVAVPGPSEEADDHLLPPFVEDEEGVGVNRHYRPVDVGQEPVEAVPFVVLHVGLAKADVDNLHVAESPGGVLGSAQTLDKGLSPHPR